MLRPIPQLRILVRARAGGPYPGELNFVGPTAFSLPATWRGPWGEWNVCGGADRLSALLAQIRTDHENADSPYGTRQSACRLEARREPVRDSALPLGSSASVAFCSIDD
jgi:hypothetical protein